MLCSALQLYPRHRVILGGTASFWQLSGHYDPQCAEIEAIFTQRNIPLISSSAATHLRASLSREVPGTQNTYSDSWHFPSSEENNSTMASFLHHYISQLEAGSCSFSVADVTPLGSALSIHSSPPVATAASSGHSGSPSVPDSATLSTAPPSEGGSPSSFNNTFSSARKHNQHGPVENL